MGAAQPSPAASLRPWVPLSPAHFVLKNNTFVLKKNTICIGYSPRILKNNTFVLKINTFEY